MQLTPLRFGHDSQSPLEDDAIRKTALLKEGFMTSQILKSRLNSSDLASLERNFDAKRDPSSDRVSTIVTTTYHCHAVCFYRLSKV